MGDDLMSLPDVSVLLEHVCTDIDMADEHVIGHRHATNDPALAAELRAVGDDLTEGWAALMRARSRLTAALATR